VNEKRIPESTGSDAQPGKTASPDAGASPVRERVLRHMRQMLGPAAIAGSTLQLSCSTPCVCDPLPPPVDCNDPNDPNCPVVCDPLPPPWICSSHPATTCLGDRRAEWVEAGDRIILRVDIIPASTAWTFLDNPVLEGATLRATAVREGALTFTCSPSNEATEVKATVEARQGDTVATLRLVLDLSGPAKANTLVPIRIAE
jgi:hypothetical protein